MTTMDYIFTVQSASGGTVTLTSSPYTVANYAQSPTSPGVPTVAETIELRVLDGTSAANLGELRSLNNLLRQAEEAQYNEALEPVYLTWQEATGGTVWRSEIMRGHAGLRDDALTRGYWTGDTAFMPMFFERRNYWEGPEAQLPLTNNNGTADTSGLTVYNANDGVGTATAYRVCNADISGGSVIGDLPAPMRLEITNTYNDATYGVTNIHAGLLTYGDLTTFNPLLEGEAGLVSGGTASADAGASGGTVCTKSITNSGDVQLFTWTVDAEQMQACAGRTYKLIARFGAGNYTDVWFYPYIYYSSVVPLAKGATVRLDSSYDRRVRDLGAVQLPPWLAGVGSPGDLYLRLYGRRAVESTQTIALDFLFLMPTDSYREYNLTGDIAYTKTLVDDGPNNRVWVQDGDGTNRAGVVTTTGRPLEVVPGRNARMFFLFNSNDTTESIDRTLSVKAYYRPRRLAL